MRGPKLMRRGDGEGREEEERTERRGTATAERRESPKDIARGLSAPHPAVVVVVALGWRAAAVFPGGVGVSTASSKESTCKKNENFLSFFINNPHIFEGW